MSRLRYFWKPRLLTLCGKGALAYKKVPLGSPWPAAGSAMNWTQVCPSVKTHPRTGGNVRLPSSTIFFLVLVIFLGSSEGLTKSLKSFRSCWQCVSRTINLWPGSHSPANLEMSCNDGFAVSKVSLKDGSCTWHDNTMLALQRKSKNWSSLLVQMTAFRSPQIWTSFLFVWSIEKSGNFHSSRKLFFTAGFWSE